MSRERLHGFIKVRAIEKPTEAISRYKELSVALPEAIGDVRFSATKINISSTDPTTLDGLDKAIDHARDIHRRIEKGPSMRVEVVLFGHPLPFIHYPDVFIREWPLFPVLKREAESGMEEKKLEPKK